MEMIDELFGHGTDLNSLQMTVRAIVIFFVTLLLIRFTGMRVFGIKTAFDTCIIIMLGAVLSRAVVGASPFIPTIVASAALVITHKIIARLSVNNQRISHMVKGKPLSIYKDGVLNEKNMKRCALSFGDIMEEIRLILNNNSLENIDEIIMERTGEISVIEKKKTAK
ncbi:MAG: DUF421 domain-containing protein [Ginsengibacter sp.]